ncbi:MAG: hypothetical protein AAGA56_11100, partial [Myxococcota bacterium]
MKVDLINGGALVLAVVASVAFGWQRSAPNPGGAAAVVDATGHKVVPPFTRIASATTIADELLLELCPRSSVVAVTEQSKRAVRGYRFGERIGLRSIDYPEPILSLSPDLLLVANVGAPRRVARLREAGLTVFDLGPPAGWASLQGYVERVGALCGEP